MSWQHPPSFCINRPRPSRIPILRFSQSGCWKTRQIADAEGTGLRRFLRRSPGGRRASQSGEGSAAVQSLRRFAAAQTPSSSLTVKIVLFDVREPAVPVPLAELLRRLPSVLAELAAEGALVVKAVRVRDVGKRFFGLYQSVTRRLHARADDKLLRAHAKHLLEEPHELPRRGVREARRRCLRVIALGRVSRGSF